MAAEEWSILDGWRQSTHIMCTLDITPRSPPLCRCSHSSAGNTGCWWLNRNCPTQLVPKTNDGLTEGPKGLYLTEDNSEGLSQIQSCPKDELRLSCNLIACQFLVCLFLPSSSPCTYNSQKHFPENAVCSSPSQTLFPGNSTESTLSFAVEHHHGHTPGASSLP